MQIAKLANMKYQDCLNLLQFMYKLWRQKVAEAAAMGKEVATK